MPWNLTTQEKKALTIVLILCGLSLLGVIIF